MKYFGLHGILIVALIITGCALAHPVLALTISPVKIEVAGDPGATVTGEILLLNEQDSEKTYYSSFSNFDSNGETGSPHFTDDASGLATWIKTESQVALQKNELKKISYSITIPQDAEPGGHFAAIFWGSEPPVPDNAGKIAVGSKLGILVLLKVSGDIKEGAGLLSFYIKDKKFLFSTLPISFEYRVSNAGADRIVPSGEIKVRNFFIIPSASLEANPKGGSVLPNSIRKIEAFWGQEPGNIDEQESPGFFAMALRELKDFHFGWYTASVNLSLGQSNMSEKASYRFFIFPWHLLSILLVILIIFGIIGFFGIKKYNKWLISKVMAQQKMQNPKL